MRKRNYSRRRMSKLYMSNNAHGRLKKKHANGSGSRSLSLYDYHNQCQIRQSAKRRILSKSERKELFKYIVGQGLDRGLIHRLDKMPLPW